jgi:hypothetical protein
LPQADQDPNVTGIFESWTCIFFSYNRAPKVILHHIIFFTIHIIVPSCPLPFYTVHPPCLSYTCPIPSSHLTFYDHYWPFPPSQPFTTCSQNYFFSHSPTSPFFRTCILLPLLSPSFPFHTPSPLVHLTSISPLSLLHLELISRTLNDSLPCYPPSPLAPTPCFPTVTFPHLPFSPALMSHHALYFCLPYTFHPYFPPYTSLLPLCFHTGSFGGWCAGGYSGRGGHGYEGSEGCWSWLLLFIFC